MHDVVPVFQSFCVSFFFFFLVFFFPPPKELVVIYDVVCQISGTLYLY